MVEDLWDRALAPPFDRLQVRERAERLLMQANSESPVVNWGLTELYHLTSRAQAKTDELAASHTRWLAEVERYEADPALWMRTYFQRLVRDFSASHGTQRGRAFAGKLVRDGHLSQLELPMELRE
jgi:hypothetical protein